MLESGFGSLAFKHAGLEAGNVSIGIAQCFSQLSSLGIAGSLTIVTFLSSAFQSVLGEIEQRSGKDVS